MFDIGFSELLVIGVVALLVLGPERLPKVARTTGHLLGRLQRYVADVKSDINREMQLDELKRMQEEARKSAVAFEASVKSEMASFETSVTASVQSATSAVAELEHSLKTHDAASKVDQDVASAMLDAQLADADGHVQGTSPNVASAEPKGEAVPDNQLGLDFDVPSSADSKNPKT